MSGSDDGASNIDDETLSIRISEVQRYASELERAVSYITNNGISESDIRFAHINAPSGYGDLSADGDKSDQVFARQGGGAAYRTPPKDISSADQWEFYGGTAIPAVGSSRADLIAVLPNVTRRFCDTMNAQLGQPETAPADTSTCLYTGATGRFNDATQFASSPNTLDELTFAQDSVTSAAKTALHACVRCSSDSAYHFYQVILAR